MNDLTKTTLTSMEVAQMVGKEHKNLVRDIRRYCEQFAETKIEPAISSRKVHTWIRTTRAVLASWSQRKAANL